MEIFANIWNKDVKYSRSNGIHRCWRKADILSTSWKVDINNDDGSAYLPVGDKNMSDNDCNNSYCMLKMMCVKVHKSNWDRNSTAYALQGSFGEDSDTDGLKDTEWGEMARNWVDI